MPTSPSNQDLLNAIHQSVGKIEGMQVAFLEQFRQHLQDDQRMWAKVDTMISQHDSHKGAAKVIMALFALISGAIGAFITKHFT